MPRDKWKSYMTLLLTFIACPELCSRSRGNRFSCYPRRSEAIPIVRWETWPKNNSKRILRYMIGTAATIALDWRQSGCIQCPARRRGSGCKTTTRTTGAGAGNVANTTTILRRGSGKQRNCHLYCISHSTSDPHSAEPSNWDTPLKTKVVIRYLWFKKETSYLECAQLHHTNNTVWLRQYEERGKQKIHAQADDSCSTNAVRRNNFQQCVRLSR